MGRKFTLYMWHGYMEFCACNSSTVVLIIVGAAMRVAWDFPSGRGKFFFYLLKDVGNLLSAKYVDGVYVNIPFQSSEFIQLFCIWLILLHAGDRKCKGINVKHV